MQLLYGPMDTGAPRDLKRPAADPDRPAVVGLRSVSPQERLRAGYLEIARREPERCVVIDADADLEAVTTAIASAVTQRLALG